MKKIHAQIGEVDSHNSENPLILPLETQILSLEMLESFVALT
jgi:hypothetical protein